MLDLGYVYVILYIYGSFPTMSDIPGFVSLQMKLESVIECKRVTIFPPVRCFIDLPSKWEGMSGGGYKQAYY